MLPLNDCGSAGTHCADASVAGPLGRPRDAAGIDRPANAAHLTAGGAAGGVLPQATSSSAAAAIGKACKKRLFIMSAPAWTQARNHARKAQLLVGRHRALPEGLLRVCSRLGFGRRHLAPALSKFARHYPELEVQLHLTDRPVTLVEQGFDLQLRFGEWPDTRLTGLAARTGAARLPLHP